jgi:hypothetical protein
MSTIDYSYTILSVGERTMEVQYHSPAHGSMFVGVRRPKIGEPLEDVIAEYAPVYFWLEQSAALEDIPAGVNGQGSIFIPTPAPPPTPEQQLEMWRNTAVISQLQAHHTLQVWGLYAQVVATVQAIGDPVLMAFERAVEWRRNSPTILALFSTVSMPDGSTPTPEVLDQFFTEAQGYQI